MTPDDPRHGTMPGVWAHRRAGQDACPACIHARRIYFRRVNKRRALGYVSQVPLGRRHAMLVQLYKSGATYERISEQFGVSISTAYRWIKGGPDMKIPTKMAVRIDQARIDRGVTGIGVLRRVQALRAIGYSGAEIARLAGLHKDTVQDGLRNRRTVWWDATAAALVGVYDQRWNMPPTGREANRARNLAKSKGYLPPLVWDDIDDENEKPHKGSDRRRRDELDEAVVLRVLAGERLEMTTAERREVVRRALKRGWSENHIEAVTGIAKATDKSRYGTEAA